MLRWISSSVFDNTGKILRKWEKEWRHLYIIKENPFRIFFPSPSSFLNWSKKKKYNGIFWNLFLKNLSHKYIPAGVLILKGDSFFFWMDDFLDKFKSFLKHLWHGKGSETWSGPYKEKKKKRYVRAIFCNVSKTPIQKMFQVKELFW